MHKVVIIGANGLVGKALSHLLQNKEDIRVINITRDNIDDFSSFDCDILINANGSGKKGWCNEHPSKSFEINCSSIYKTFSNFSPKRYILISSVDVYPKTKYKNETIEEQIINTDSLCPYCLHKYFAELIVINNFSNSLILRLSNVIGPELKKNVLFDITRKRNLFLSPNSKMNFIDTSAIAEIVYSNLFSSKYKVMNCAANNSIKVQDIIDNLNLKEFYKSFENASLPLFYYEINTSRLSEVFRIESSNYYVQRYLSYLQKSCK